MDQETRSAFAALTQRLDSFAEHAGKGFEDIDKRFDAVDKRFDDHAQQLKLLQQLVGVIGSSLADLHHVTGELAKQVAETNRRIDMFVPHSISARTEELERYAALERRIDELAREVASLQLKLGPHP